MLIFYNRMSISPDDIHLPRDFQGHFDVDNRMPVEKGGKTTGF